MDKEDKIILGFVVLLAILLIWSYYYRRSSTQASSKRFYDQDPQASSALAGSGNPYSSSSPMSSFTPASFPPSPALLSSAGTAGTTDATGAIGQPVHSPTILNPPYTPFRAYEWATNRFVTTVGIQDKGVPELGEALIQGINSRDKMHRPRWQWQKVEGLVTSNANSPQPLGVIAWAGYPAADALCWEISPENNVQLQKCNPRNSAQLWQSPLDANVFITQDGNCIHFDHHNILAKGPCNDRYPIKVATLQD